MKIKIQKKLVKITLFSTACLILIFSRSATSQSTSSTAIPPVSLAHTPLNSSRIMDKPTMTLALSVEFPTIGALYRNGQEKTDDSYDPSKEYIGYFYSKGCYSYLASPTENPSSPETKNDYKRFKFAYESSLRSCNDDKDKDKDKFSGNFLNWAASSSIDILRIALSGGDRYIDKDGLTILQRAVVPAGTPKVACLWNHEQFFPAKKLARSKFSGAIPKILADKAGSNDLWIANRHNGIYFNKYASNQTPTIRGWDNACDISTDVTNYTNFLKGNPSKGDVQITPDGFYYARVEVCSKNQNGTVDDHKDFGLCTQQPNGNFKPTGVIQKNANNLRIAAFGYTLDHSSSRYGGVLRAPMRYVGPKSFDIYGREEAGANPYAEWDSFTGILKDNPYKTTDSSLASWPSEKLSSGVINYLNKFGRLGSTVATGPTTDTDSNFYYGEYKRNDPISSLYHQALRYLQGLPNIADASNNLTNKYYDGFPIYTNWNTIDPYGDGRSATENYACLKNSIVAVGDIYSQENTGWKTVSSDDTSRKNIDFSGWLTKAINYEKNNFSNTITTNDRNKIIGYSYWAHANDIRGQDWTEQPDKQRKGLRVKTFIFDVNEKGDSSDLATRSKSNQFFIASKYGGYETDANNKDKSYYSVDEKPNKGYDPNETTTPKTLLTKDAIWQRRPIAEKDDASGKLYDAATYYLQSDARSVLTAFDEIFDRAAETAQSIVQSAASTSTITAQTNSQFFTATYDLSSWTGNIQAQNIIIDSKTKNVSLVKDTSFDPASSLNKRASSTRNIVIGLGGNQAASSFEWSLLQGTTAQTQLSKASASATADGLGEARLNYIRGSRANEGKEFRVRSSLLGDIINSGVTYSGAPTNKYTDKSYQLFLKANQNRLPIVITGANDGMLHAFSGQNSTNINKSDEVFAYIPSWLTPKLSSLADPNYVNNHQAFVDAPSTVGEAQVTFTGGDGSANDWKTVLVSGTGGGGRGVFALDITDPTAFSASKVMWEFTNSDDSDMGYVVGKPKILKFKTGFNTYRWFAAVASGVNNYASSFESGGGSGSPAIFLLALDKPITSAWSLGENYFKINFPVDSNLSSSMAPGMLDFSTLWALDGSVTHIYAGDLHGNLWKLDFTDSKTKSGYKPTSDWNITKLSFFKKGDPSQPLPFYQAMKTISNSTVRQPISSAPLLVTGPIVQGIETFYVLFGTGKYLENSDISNNTTQSFYALYDNGDIKSDSTNSTRTAAITPGTSRLQQATIDTTKRTINIPSFIWGRPENSTQAATIKSGWYFDFPINSERMVYSASDIGSFNVTFNSVIPNSNQSSQAVCATDNASSNTYDINIKTGAGSYRVSQIGILGPSLFLSNEEKESTSSFDSTGRAKRTIVQEEISSGSKGNEIRSSSLVEFVGRLSWRQIYNYKELKHKGTSSSTTNTTTSTTTP